MKRSLLTFIFVLSLLLAVPCTDVAAKDTWTRVRSKNFLLIGNASEKEIRKVGVRLEQFRDVFARLFTKANFKSSVATTVIVFKSDGSFKPFKPLYQGKAAFVSGYFQPGEDINYIALSTDGETEYLYRTIFHEYVHWIVNNNVQNPPAWFNEGLAEYYSTFAVTDGERKAQLGRIIPQHVMLLREKFIPLRALFAVDHNSPLYNERDKQSVFYAESWALIHYLNLGNDGRRRPQLGQFLSKLLAGTTVDDAFHEAFQTDYTTLEKELKDYVKRNSYMQQVATFEKKLEFDTQMQSAPVAEAEAQAYLGDLLLHTNRLDEAAARLQQALALDPESSLAHASLGLVRVRQKKFDEAKEELHKAVAGDPQNHLAHYYYAYTLSREGMDRSEFVSRYDDQTVQTMRAELRKAIELNPDFTESYHLLAFINLVRGEQLDESITMLRRALALTPGRESYWFVLGELYLHKRDFKTARQILEPMARSSSDTQLRAQAQHMLNQATAMEEHLARMKASRETAAEDGAMSTGAVGSSIPRPVDEKTIERARQASLEAALRKPVAGEERARGLLLSIDCGSQGAAFSIKAGERTLKLMSSDFARIKFTAFTPELRGEISCGQRSPANPVNVIYRPAKGGHNKSDGEIVAVDFLPRDFPLNMR